MAAITAAAGEIYAATGRYANTIYADPITAYELLGLVSAVSPIFLSTGGGNLSSGNLPVDRRAPLVAPRDCRRTPSIVGDSSALLTRRDARRAGRAPRGRAVDRRDRGRDHRRLRRRDSRPRPSSS